MSSNRVTQAQVSKQVTDMREIVEVKLDNLSSELGRVSDIVLENRSEIDQIKIDHAREQGKHDERERVRKERDKKLNLFYGTIAAIVGVLTIVSMLLP